MTTLSAGAARSAADPGTRTLAVIVSAGVTPYLGRTLTAVASQSRIPDVVLVIDVASRANGLGDGTPIEDAVDLSGLDAVSDVRIVRAAEAPTFLAAVRAGLARYGELIAVGNRRRSTSSPTGSLSVTRSTSSLAAGRSRALTDALGEDAPLTGPDGARSPITRDEAAATGRDEWLWLLHDDSAPAPHCLAELLSAAQDARSVALAGPKQVGWEDPDTLLEVGLRTTASARRANDIVDGEVDQGQHDDRSDVLAVGTAGALVARTAWDTVAACGSGVTADVDAFGDSLALSRALRLQGHRVIVVPTARLSHRRAAYLGLRGPGVPAQSARTASPRERPAASAPPADEPRPDTDRSFRARRAAQLRSWATASPAPLPLLLAWFCVLAGARALWRLVAKSPALARDELAAAGRCLRDAARVRRDRRRLAALTTARRDVLAQLYLPASEIRAARRDLRRQEREREARAAAPSELELRELAALARRRRHALGLSLLLVTALALVGTSGVLVTRAVTGGALASLGGWQQTWEAAWSTWAAAGDGYRTGASPFLAVLVPPLLAGSWVGLDGDALVHVLLVLAPPLAAAGAWFAAGTVTRRTSLRAWAALAWALAPALLLAVGQGRLGPVLVHLVLPWALTALSRAVGADRRDVVLSGLVGAHHVSEQEKAELDRFASETVGSLAELADLEHTAPNGPENGAQEDLAAQADDEDSPAAPEPQDAPVPPAPVRGARAAAARAAATEAYGPGSPAAAAAAGLLLSLVVAAVPSTALVVLPGLVLLTALSRGSRARLLLTLLPVTATAAPLLWRAAELALQDGGPEAWREGLRYLLTDWGQPVAVPAAGGLEMLLGVPVRLSPLLATLTGFPVHDTVTAIVVAALALLPLGALLGTLAGGARGHRARAGLLASAAGLALALVAARTVTAVGTQVDATGSVLVAGWAGTGLSLMTAGLLASALAGADAVRTRLLHHAFGWHHLALATASAAALLVPVIVGGSWALAAQQASAAGRAELVMALTPSWRQVPVIAAEITASDTAGRVLVLTSTDEGLRASLWHGDGTAYTDTAPDVLLAQLHARADGWAQLETRPVAPAEDLPEATITGSHTDTADADLLAAVARAVSGQDREVADVLASHGIAVVLLTDMPGDETTATARAGLDATPGLEPLATTAVGTSWRVGPTGAAQVGAVFLRSADGTNEVLPSAAGTVRTQVSAATSERTLVLAERSDTGWSATLNGAPLAATDDTGWNQAFTLPAGASGELVVRHASGPARVLRPALLAVWALTALAALPVRRRRIPT
ncbi:MULTISPECIES: glycosyltransferase [Actinomyces]|uniref:glycosyltransferase n=1 Tax=Actinomyces TaxID=1654 RepID=UPI0014212589|nr:MULTISPECIES: glycosyltransferase [Actinomyces]